MPKVPSDFPSVPLTINVYGTKVDIDLAEWAEELLVDPNDLSKQLERQSRRYFDIAEYAACAAATVERRKQAFEIWQAEKWREIFDAAAGRGEKAPTVDSAKAQVKADPEYKKRLDLMMDAQEDASMLENARDAMKMRQFMLTHLTGALKAEGV